MPYRESWDSERKIAEEFRKINNGTTQDYDRMLQEAKGEDKIKKSFALDSGISLMIGMIIIYFTNTERAFWHKDPWFGRCLWGGVDGCLIDDLFVWSIIVFILISAFKKYKHQS
tara:strand:+ start:269 stop:610 length:342 start_codon:yes stop_codon:yes gene_type:complete